jgi:hypothetical protein
LSSPSESQIIDAHEEFWRWIFREKDGDNHPLKISDGNTAQIQHDSILILAGSLPDDKLRNRTLQKVQDVKYIFVPGENCVYTKADKDGNTNKDLVDRANNDMKNSRAKVKLNDVEQDIHHLLGHTFSLDIQQCIGGAGNSGKGEGESCAKGIASRNTEAAAACDYAIILANDLKSGNKIKIEGIGRAGPNKTPGDINVTYTVQ